MCVYGLDGALLGNMSDDEIVMEKCVCVCVCVRAMAVTEARGPRVEGPLYSTYMCDQTRVGMALAVPHWADRGSGSPLVGDFRLPLVGDFLPTSLRGKTHRRA